MELVQTNIDALNATVKITLTEADYKPQVEKALKLAATKVTMPGFRAGMVPMGMVKKTYGKSILLEELNKVINKGLANYLVQNKLEVLGQPLPKINDTVDIEKGGDLVFNYEMGIAPKIELNFTNANTVNYYTIKLNEQLLSKYKNDITRRNGSYETPQIVGDSDLIYIDLVELDAAGEVLAGGIFRQSTLAIDMIKSESFKNNLIGKTQGDIVVVNVKDLSSSSIDLASILSMDKASAEQITSNFNIKVGTISRVVPAVIGQDFYTKMYGAGVVNNDAEFNAKISEEITAIFANDSDRRLRYDIQTQLLQDINPALPDKFLKRWIKESNQNPLTLEQIDSEYPNYSKALKVQIIESKIMNEYKLGVDRAEVVNATKQMLIEQYFKNAIDTIEESFLIETANKILQKDEEYRRVSDIVLDRKIVGLYKEKFNLSIVQLSYDDFVIKMNEA